MWNLKENSGLVVLKFRAWHTPWTGFILALVYTRSLPTGNLETILKWVIRSSKCWHISFSNINSVILLKNYRRLHQKIFEYWEFAKLLVFQSSELGLKVLSFIFGNLAFLELTDWLPSFSARCLPDAQPQFAGLPSPCPFFLLPSVQMSP